MTTYHPLDTELTIGEEKNGTLVYNPSVQGHFQYVDAPGDTGVFAALPTRLAEEMSYRLISVVTITSPQSDRDEIRRFSSAVATGPEDAADLVRKLNTASVPTVLLIDDARGCVTGEYGEIDPGLSECLSALTAVDPLDSGVCVVTHVREVPYDNEDGLTGPFTWQFPFTDRGLRLEEIATPDTLNPFRLGPPDGEETRLRVRIGERWPTHVYTRDIYRN